MVWAWIAQNARQCNPHAIFPSLPSSKRERLGLRVLSLALPLKNTLWHETLIPYYYYSYNFFLFATITLASALQGFLDYALHSTLPTCVTLLNNTFLLSTQSPILLPFFLGWVPANGQSEDGLDYRRTITCRKKIQ